MSLTDAVARYLKVLDESRTTYVPAARNADSDYEVRRRRAVALHEAEDALREALCPCRGTGVLTDDGSSECPCGVSA